MAKPWIMRIPSWPTLSPSQTEAKSPSLTPSVALLGLLDMGTSFVLVTGRQRLAPRDRLPEWSLRSSCRSTQLGDSSRPKRNKAAILALIASLERAAVPPTLTLRTGRIGLGKVCPESNDSIRDFFSSSNRMASTVLEDDSAADTSVQRTNGSSGHIYPSGPSFLVRDDFRILSLLSLTVMQSVRGARRAARRPIQSSVATNGRQVIPFGSTGPSTSIGLFSTK